jgi:hypothetical protein
MTEVLMFRALEWIDEHAEITCVAMVALLVTVVGLAPVGIR